MDLVGYLETLPQEALSRLYSSPWTSQAVLRGLPPLGKLYTLRMLYLEHPLANSIIESWPRPEGVAKHKIALQKLRRLQILQEGPKRSVLICKHLHSSHFEGAQCTCRGNEATWILQPDFQSRLRKAVGTDSPGDAEVNSIPEEVFRQAPVRSELDKYAESQWEALCLYLVGSNDKPPKEAAYLGKAGWMDVDALLISAKLLTKEGGVRECTESGIKFLMLDTYNQLWLLLKQYTEAAATRSGARLAKVVSFLLQLGCQGVGNPISTAGFDELQQSIGADLARLGLLKPFKANGVIWLSPTRLSLALSGGQSVEAQKEVTDGFILVETNYKVVAYTSSALKVAILRQFVRCDVVLPNAFVGTLTRESVTSALKQGINHELIVRYLTQHADPHVASSIPIVPAVVSDQIRLWQAETQRVQHYKAHMYDNFETEELFHKTADHTKLLGTWLWQDDQQQRLVALSDGHDQTREFIRNNK